MNNYHLTHMPYAPYQLVLKDGTVKIMLISDTDLGEFDLKCLWSDPSECSFTDLGEKKYELRDTRMELRGRTEENWFYEASLDMEGAKLRYYFIFDTPEGKFSFDERGVCLYKEEYQDKVRGFFVDWSFIEERFHVDASMQDIVWYQIFPDRFSSSINDSTGYPDIDESNKNGYFFHGNLDGIQKALPYIKALGANGIYLNPIFKAYSIHKYDTVDYGKIDPWFGTEEDFGKLCNEVHRLGMKIMLDGVFNHVSDKFPLYQDVLEKENESAWKDWFIRRDSKTDNLAEKCRVGNDGGYETFCFVQSMPKLNTRNYYVQSYLIEKAVYWTKKYSIDAWRLDVPDEVSTSFLVRFREAIHEVSPYAYIIGEIWSNPYRWLKGDMFDGVMNYTLYFAIRDFFREKDDVKTFLFRLETYAFSCPLEIQQGMFNMTGNHDLPRFITLVNGSANKTSSAFLLTAMMPGNLNVYYGEEIFLEGKADPYNRKVFPWNEAKKIDSNRKFMREVISFYHSMDRTNLKYIGSSIKDNLLEMKFTGKESYALCINLSTNEKVLDEKCIITNGNIDIQGRVILAPWASAVRRVL